MHMSAKLANEITSWVVPVEYAGMRVDRVLALLAPELSRVRAREVIEAGQVTLAGKQVTSVRQQVTAGEEITATSLPQTELDELPPEAMPLDILGESDHYIVINKPANLVMHPSRGHRGGTLANALVAHTPAVAKLPRAGIVHRLDKDTSGVLVAAKTEQARLNLIDQFRTRQAKRSYYAIVHGQPNTTGVIDLKIGRDNANRTKMAVNQSGKEAVTRWQVLATTPAYSLLSCTLESGRTHQIRVHMERLGHPVAGDKTYRRHARSEAGQFPRQLLHAYQLQFADPISNEVLEFHAPLPADFQIAQQQLGLQHA